MSDLLTGTETSDSAGAFPRLSDAQIEALAALGERRTTRADEVLYTAGEVNCDFFVVLAGTVKLVEGHGSGQERRVSVHGHGRFLGGLGLFTGQAMLLTAAVEEPGEVLAVPAPRFREYVARDPELGDLILRAYLIRHSLLIGLGAGLRIIGSRFSPDTRRLREFAARNRLPHRWLDLEEDSEAEALLREFGISPAETPVVIWRGRQLLRNPSNTELARMIGLSILTEPETVGELVVVGAGPAGLAVAVYGASEGLNTIALDAVATGGQAGTSSRIENYLGFPVGISGAELADRATIQARKFGARITVPTETVGLAERDGYYVVRLDDGRSVAGRTIVVATGARYRRLDVPRLEEFEGTSVYYAATEVEAKACRRGRIVIVGGGNSAGQATLFLADQPHVLSVRLLIRGHDLGKSMSRYLVDRIARLPNVEVLRHTEVRELSGTGGRLTAVVVEDNQTGERREESATALFAFIGAEPHSGWLGGQLALDNHGFVLTGEAAARADGTSRQHLSREPFLLETNRPGVFAIGDVRSGSVKRVASAVGEGAMAVRMVHEYLGGLHRPTTDSHAAPRPPGPAGTP